MASDSKDSLVATDSHNSLVATDSHNSLVAIVSPSVIAWGFVTPSREVVIPSRSGQT